jgi:hypothetical protein
VLNKAAIELGLGQTEQAQRDLDLAERLVGPQVGVMCHYNRRC